MNESLNLRDTITPKSDQINADDLMGVEKTITVTGVKRGSADQPVSIHYEGDDGRPYKPCKSMRRVLITCWGDDGHAWVGGSMRLYCDPDVKWGGVKVGGIRISHLTGIDRTMHLALTATKGKREPYKVEPMEPPTREPYPSELFTEKFPAIEKTVIAEKMTHEQAIARLEQTGALTEEQRAQVRDIKAKEQSE